METWFADKGPDPIAVKAMGKTLLNFCWDFFGPRLFNLGLKTHCCSKELKTACILEVTKAVLVTQTKL